MAGFISVGRITVAGVLGGGGLFNGQNMQSGWDSHSTTVGSKGGIGGRGCAMITDFGLTSVTSFGGQVVTDRDIKTNRNQVRMW